jgi:hypothetical protein
VKLLVKLLRKLSHIDLSERASSQDKVGRKLLLDTELRGKKWALFSCRYKAGHRPAFSTCIRTKATLFEN